MRTTDAVRTINAKYGLTDSGHVPIRRGRFCGAALLLLTMTLVIASSRHAAVAEQPQQVLSEIGIDPRLGATVPREASFVDHQGRSVRLGAITDQRPVVLCLVYFRCPMLCSLTADGLVKGLRELSPSVGREFDVVMVSFDPREGPQQAAAARRTALKRYDRAGAERGWHALTGDQDAIDALTESVGFRYRWDESLGQYAHAAGLVVLTPEGRVSGYLNGVQFPPKQLSAAIDRADQGDVASTSPASFLRCYLYDPATGQFGMAVQWTVRGLGMLTVVGLAAGVGVMTYREKRSNPSQSTPKDP